MSKSQFKLSVLLGLALLLMDGAANGQADPEHPIRFVDYFFENGSPVSWEARGDSLKVLLIEDHERGTPNRQTDHWNFRVVADKGTEIKLVISKLRADVYNGFLATRWWSYKEGIGCYLSYDGTTWEPIHTTRLPNNDLSTAFTMLGDSVYVARLPPYTEKNLERLKDDIRPDPLVKIIRVGFTVGKRPLEIIRVGDPHAKYSIFLRARAHPWEPGGNWVVEGVIRGFLKGDDRLKKQICYYIMPMANKDGVFRGMTRFNLAGKDLNRNWLEETDSAQAPENFAIKKFMTELLRSGIKPVLAIDLHNDDSGDIHLTLPKDDDTTYLKKMELFRQIATEQTWFSRKLLEKRKIVWGGDMSDGMYYQFGIDAFVLEFNGNYIEKLHKIPEAVDWIDFGQKLNGVFYRYLTEQQKIH